MHRRTLIFSGLLAVALLSAPAAAPAARPAWTPPRVISDVGMNHPHPVMDRDGGALVLLGSATAPFHRVFATTRLAGGSFSQPVGLPALRTSSVSNGGTAMTYDSDGRLLLMWKDENDDGSRPVRYAIRGSDGRWSEARPFRPATVSMPTLRADGRGNIFAAWIEPSGSQYCCNGAGPFVARMSDGKPFGAPQRLSDRTSSLATLDVAPSGAAVAAWPYSRFGYKVSVRPPGGAFGPTETIPGVFSGFGFEPVQVAMANDGEALFAFMHYTFSGNTQQSTSMVFVARRPDGSYSEPQTLTSAGIMSHPAIAAGPPGQAVVSWTEGSQDNATLLGAVRGPDGRFAAPVTLEPDGLWLSPQPTAMDGDGNAMVTWAGDRDAAWTVYAAHRPPGGNFGRPQAISTEKMAARDRYPDPRLAFGESGNALVAWDHTPQDTSAGWVEASVFDIAPPRLSDVRVSRRLTVRWTISELATVKIAIRRDGRELRSAQVRARVGRNTRRFRRGRLRAGRYTAVLTATDHLGRISKARARFRLPRR